LVCLITKNIKTNQIILSFILGKAVFPDYFYPPAKEWWKNQVLNYHKQLKFDALWIDMK